MEQVVVDVALLVGVAHIDGLRELLGSHGERSGVVGAIHRVEVTGIVEQRRIGSLTVGRARLCLESLCVGVGCTQVVTRVEAGVADLRAEVADLLQAVLDLRSALGIEFECLVVGLDGLCHGSFVNELRLLPGLHLAVHDVDREPRIDPGLHLGAVHRLGAGRLCVADSELEHRGVHADEEALRRFGGSLVEGLAAVDPRCGLDAFLCVGDVRVAFLDLRQQCVFVHFLSLGSRDCQDQCGERRHKSLFHKKLNFRFAITLPQ